MLPIKVDLFVYGTLMFPQIMMAVIGRAPASAAAVLPGYARYRLGGACYPAIAPDASASTSGLLYLGVDPPALRRLDRFEGAQYRRVSVQVLLATGGVRNAHTYVLRPGQSSRLCARAWEPQELSAAGLRRFRHTYGGFRRSPRTMLAPGAEDGRLAFLRGSPPRC